MDTQKNNTAEMNEELLKLRKYVNELEDIIAQKEVLLHRQDSSEMILLELLKEKNQKQSEVDELLVKLKDKDDVVAAYSRMCEDYRVAAEDRWNRLQFYEGNKFFKTLCSLFIRLKKKNSENETTEEKELKYYSLYSKEEKAYFEKCKSQVLSFTYKPLISLVIPVYNTDLRLLDELIYSIQEQSYTNWEICFANGSFENEKLCAALEKYSQSDKRIRYANLKKNGGISYNTNEAFALATGEFIGMVDHDDLLTPNALYEIVKVLNEDPKMDFIYSDQDKVNEETTARFGVLHKPSWSMEMLYSGNYITHFSVIRKSLVEQVGGWDSEVDGAQDWDIFLKVAEKTKRIKGIPLVLYHWRTATTSTALSMGTKSYALDAQIKSLQNHFDRMRYPAEAYFSCRETYEIRIKWNYRERFTTSIIIWDQGINVDLNSYIQFMHLEMKDRIKEVIVISDSWKRLNSITQDCKKVYEECTSYAEAYNKGAQHATGDVYIFAVDRAVPVDVYTYDELSDWALHDQIGMVGPKVLYGNRKVNSMGIILNYDKPRSLFHKYDNFSAKATEFGNTIWYRNVNALDYCCIAVAKKKFEEMGLFDETYGDLSIIEYCLRVGREYRNMSTPFAVVQYNFNFPKSIAVAQHEDYVKLLEKFRKPVIDEFYNPEFYEIEKEMQDENVK